MKKNVQVPANKSSTAKSNTNKAENDQAKLRKEQATKFENYIHESGLAMGFQLIFAELISKKISPENYFQYVTIRLKEIGRELDSLKVKPEEKPEVEDNEEKKDNADGEDD
jgi:hypothetical protein